MEDLNTRDIFGGCTVLLLLASCIFNDGQPAGFVHYVEWQTATPVTVGGFVLFAEGDGPASNNQREFEQFVLKAKSSSAPRTMMSLFLPMMCAGILCLLNQLTGF